MKKEQKNLPTGITWFAGKYRVRLQFKGKQYNAGMYETLRDAKEAQKFYKRQAMMGTFVPFRERHRRWRAEREAEAATKVSFGDFAQQWLRNLQTGVEARAESTIRSYTSTLNQHLLPTLSNMFLMEIEQTHVDRLIAEVQRESGPGAARNAAILLRSIFNSAVKEGAGGLTSMPFRVRVTKPSTRGSELVPTPPEVMQIAAFMPESLRLAPVLSAVCALRPGEVLGLQRADIVGVESEAPYLNIARQWNQKTSPPSYTPPKFDSDRAAPIPKFLIPAIITHLEEYVGPEEDSPLFPSPMNPTRSIGHNTYGGRWRKAVEAAGLAPFTLHSLRHLGLSLLAVVGATQAEVMARGGHRDVEAAQRYQHQLRGRGQELTNLINEQWEAAQ